MKTKLQILNNLLERDYEWKSDLQSMESRFSPVMYANAMEETDMIIGRRKAEIALEEAKLTPGGITLENLENLLSNMKAMEWDQTYVDDGLDAQIEALEGRIADIKARDEAEEDNPDLWIPDEEMPDVNLPRLDDINIRLSDVSSGGAFVDPRTKENISITIGEGEDFIFESKYQNPKSTENVVLISGGTTNNAAEIAFPPNNWISFRIDGSIILPDGGCMFPITRSRGSGVRRMKLVREGECIFCYLDNWLNSKIRYSGSLRFSHIGERPDGTFAFEPKIYYVKLSNSTGEQFIIDFNYN